MKWNSLEEKYLKENANLILFHRSHSNEVTAGKKSPVLFLHPYSSLQGNFFFPSEDQCYVSQWESVSTIFNITLFSWKCFPLRIINFLLEIESWHEASQFARKGNVLQNWILEQSKSSTSWAQGWTETRLAWRKSGNSS